GQFVLSFEQAFADDVSISIVDLQGKTLWREIAKNHEGIYRRELDIQQFAAGMYMLQLKNKEGELTRRIIIGE
ncbi:MAG: T9SS type A sorting domain-containing protein, partial [Cryomorphaceae bacterium]|nr:T9SS type A sorting domain-containing protein [Cryomorphaceae bacterium]